MDNKKKVSPYERQLNLIVALLNTQSYLTADDIREQVAGYDNSGEAFRQMFERDKKDLLSLGLPLQVGRDNNNPHVDGYRIFSEDYTYPAINFSNDEIRTLTIAVQLFNEKNYGEAQSALDKLQTSTVSHSEFDFINARKPLSEEMITNLAVFNNAAIDHKVVTFSYHTAQQFTPTERIVEPWGIVADQGKWYCIGFDQRRNDIRVFRASRIVSKVKSTLDNARQPRPAKSARALLHEQLAHVRQYTSAVVEVVSGKAQSLQEAADSITASNGTNICTFDAVSSPWLITAVLAEGEDAWIISPESLRQEIISTLQNVVDKESIS